MQRPDRVSGGDLGCLVEDDDVEAPLGRQQLRHDQRGHSPARPECAEDMRGSLEELPDRQVAALEAGLVLDDVGFLRVLIPHAGGVLGHGPPNALRGAGNMRPVGGLELGDRTQVSLAVEGTDPRVSNRHGVQDRCQPHVFQAGQRLIGAEVPVGDLLHHRPQACCPHCRCAAATSSGSL